MASLALIHFLLFLIPFVFLPTQLVNSQAPAGAPTSSASCSAGAPSAASCPSGAPSASATSPTASSPAAITSVPAEIQKICSATRFPDVCASSMANSTNAGKAPQPVDIVKSAITVSLVNTIAAQEKVTKVLEGAGNNVNLSMYSANCLEELSDAMFRLRSSIDALPSKTKDGRAWMSAALLCHYDCLNKFKYVNDTEQIHSVLSFFESLIKITGNALSLVRSLDLFGSDTGKWAAPKTERDGFFEPVKSNDLEFPTKFPADLEIGATVSKSGNGYKTVQEAVNAAPSNLTADKKFVINIKEGVYDEIIRVPLDKPNLVFLGDGIGKTIISEKLTVGPPGVFTYNTATVAVLGDGFMAKDITFKNIAGAPTNPAVALRSDSDKSYFENCEFVGHQDTLHSRALRQYYKSCRIEGNVDFIIGNSAAYFKDCNIFINPRLENPAKGQKNTVTAHGRIDPGQSTGFVFDNCSITGTPEYLKLFDSNPKVHHNFLGRPRKKYSRTVFIRSFIDRIIAPAGWLERGGNRMLSTVYCGEFENKGPGSDLKGRVKWSSQIPPQHVPTFSVQNFMQGDEWLPKA